jgi:hypothetical protein
MTTFAPHEHRNGKWVQFELANPKEVQLVVAEGKAVTRMVVKDPEEIAAIIRKTKMTADGRMLGIFVKAAKSHVPGGSRAVTDANGDPVLDPKTGEPKRDEYKGYDVVMPNCIAPQREVLGRNGQQNLEWADNGRVHTVLIPLEACKNVAVIDITTRRDDIPEHRRKTMNENYKPVP